MEVTKTNSLRYWIDFIKKKNGERDVLHFKFLVKKVIE